MTPKNWILINIWVDGMALLLTQIRPDWIWGWVAAVLVMLACWVLTWKSLEDQERANRAHHRKLMGNLMKNVIHDLSSPLAVLSMTLDSDSTPSPVKKTMDRLLSMLRDYRVYCNQAMIEPPGQVSVQSVVSNAVELSQKKAKSKSIQVTVGENHAPIQLECFPNTLSIAVAQLIHNAIDATQSSKDSWVKIEFESSGDQVQIHVTNSGITLKAPPDAIFDPFYSTLPNENNVGMGLTIAREIAQKHQGVLEITQREPDTRFTIVVPKKMAA